MSCGFCFIPAERVDASVYQAFQLVGLKLQQVKHPFRLSGFCLFVCFLHLIYTYMIQNSVMNLSIVYTQNMGLPLSMATPFMGFPPLIFSSCDCLEFCPLFLQAIKDWIFQQSFSCAVWCHQLSQLLLLSVSIPHRSAQFGSFSSAFGYLFL